MHDLGTLGGSASDASGINASGQVTGSSYITGDKRGDAFLYTVTPGSGGAMADLGTLGGTNSKASAINSFGQIVGYSQTTGNAGQHASLYTGTPGHGGQMIDLNSWLDANNPTAGALWTLANATGITDSGLVTGHGLYNGQQQAFILDAGALAIPEPASLALLAMGGLALLGRRRPVGGGHAGRQITPNPWLA